MRKTAEKRKFVAAHFSFHEIYKQIVATATGPRCINTYITLSKYKYNDNPRRKTE